MLTSITYNCNPESLGDVTPEEFTSAFAKKVHARYQDLAVTVTFDSAPSNVIWFASNDWEADIWHEDEFAEEFEVMANLAFMNCL